MNLNKRLDFGKYLVCISVIFLISLFTNPVKAQFYKSIESNQELFEIETQLSINIDSALVLTKQLLANDQQLSEKESKWLFTITALVHQLHGNGYEAAVNLEKAKAFEVSDDYLNAYVLYTDALINIEISNEPQALEAILEAIELFDALEKSNYLARCYTVLSKVYSNLEQPDKSISNLKKALSIHKSNQNQRKIAGDYHNLAILSMAKNPDSSLVLINQAIEINLKDQNLRWLANNYHFKSYIFIATDIKDSAFQYMLKAEKLYGKLHFKTLELSSTAEIGHQYYNLQQFDSAKFKYLFVITESKHLSDNLDFSTIYKNLSDIYFHESKYDTARDYTHLYIETKDSINQKRNKQILSVVSLRAKYQLQKEELILENEKIRLSVQRKNTLIIALVILIVMIIFFIYNIYKWRKLDRKKNDDDAQLHQKEIELKNKELTLAVLGQLKQTKSLDKLEERLTILEEKAPKKLKPELSKLITEVSRDNGPLLWKEFELRFSNVHNDFYTRLKERAPDLTPAEIKVCSFLKLGLNSKEISSLLFKNPSSIEVDRARIRKKLGLTNSKANLSSYIFDI